jgi:CRP/FNR family transcriptional regulator, cyclic AMP receptor protein
VVNRVLAEWAVHEEKRMDHRELLTNFYLFTDATANDLRALEAISEPRVCIAGDAIYHAGEAADALFLIEMGTVDIMPAGKETVFATMGSGQGFGELAFFERGPRPAAAYAREPAHLLRIPFARLAQVCTERPELALLVYRNACAFFAKHIRRMALALNHRYL